MAVEQCAVIGMGDTEPGGVGEAPRGVHSHGLIPALFLAGALVS